MTIYFISFPEENGDRAELDLLLNALEKRYEVITRNTIMVIADDARVDPLLRDLAMDLNQGKKAIFERPKEAKPTLPKNGKGKEPVVVQTATEVTATATQMTVETALAQPEGETEDLELPHCLYCHNEFKPHRRNQKCCSITCSNKYSKRKWYHNKRAGDGIVHGKIAKH